MAESIRTNVLGGKLLPCCFSPMTGFYRDGYCRTGPGDYGLHTVCVEVTAEFLAFSRTMGNDLSTPIPQYQFAGLEPGDRWCLCVTRWKQALDAGMAPACGAVGDAYLGVGVRFAGGFAAARGEGRDGGVTFTANALLGFCHPELVEGSVPDTS